MDWREKLAAAFDMEVPAAEELQRAEPEVAVPAAEQQGSNRIDVRLEKKGRAGKQVTAVMGLCMDEAARKTLAAELKRHCGVGGSLDGEERIIVQGDKRQRVVDYLTAHGYKARIV